MSVSRKVPRWCRLYQLHDDVHTREEGSSIAKRFAKEAFDSIAFNCSSRLAFPDYQTKSRTSLTIRDGINPERPPPNLYRPGVQHVIELVFTGEPAIAGQPHWCLSGLDRQALTALCSASIDYFLTVTRGHSGAEAVRALSFDDAGLECSLHGFGRLTPRGARF
jgi:hypothetical protein